MESEEDFVNNALVAQHFKHNHYAAIGRIAVNWALFESIIDSSLQTLAGLNYGTAICFTSQISGSSRKLDAYLALAKMRSLPDGLTRDLNRFANETIPLAEKRNRYIHDVWIMARSPAVPERIEKTARKKLRVEAVPTSTSELEQFEAAITRHWQRFDRLHAAVLDAPHSLLDTSPE